MNLAFYYHIPLSSKGKQLFLPSYLGVFLEEVAKQVDELYLFMHEAQGKEIKEADYELKAQNIHYISLGHKTSSLHRLLFPTSIVKQKLKEVEHCDVFLIRSPSPLARKIRVLLKNPTPVYMIVGDYAEGAKQIGRKGLKNFLLYYYFSYVDKRFRATFSTTDVVVNSPSLLEKYKGSTQSIDLIKTSTLSESDYFQKQTHELQQPIQVLYTGRIEKAKGLTELVEVIALLTQEKQDVCLNIVGWETSQLKPFEAELKQLATQLNIEDKLIFHGKKTVGEELNSFYRNADIYVIPSYHEGFPRTIWEAMANSLPVIATNVGGIPNYLNNKQHALIVPPKDVLALKNAIQELIDNKELREDIMKNAYTLAQEVSLKNQTQKLIEILNQKT
ncbi:MAG: glycosyltransferase [Crocinitomicaceae bacterium]|nr:glycosyltransferase [Crocinitomicaceae bacterium]